MNLQVFRFPSHAPACVAARGLQGQGFLSRAGIRHEQAYLTVLSDRPDVGALVRELVPMAVPVNLEHLPAPLPNEAPLSS